MDKDFLDYYNRELQFLFTQGAEFSEAHPHEAGKLMLEQNRCADPHVERMLQGFALLAARIHKKIDDEYPEIADALLSILYPHYQRPIPSMAVVQFATPSDPTKATEGLSVARGTELTSPPVSGIPCRFRTAYPLTLWPVVVDKAVLSPDRVPIPGKPAGAVALLRLTLRCTAPGGWSSLEGLDTLRIFLDGAEPVPTSLYEALFNNLCEVWVQGPAAGGAMKTEVLAHAGELREAVLPVGFGPQEGVLPYPAQSFDGYRLLQEFFAFPAKFLFVDLARLDRVRAAGFTGPVDVLFFLTQPPRSDVVIRADNFRLGCAPVVNLFPMTAEPIRLNHLQTRYPVVPKYGQVGAYEVFSIDRVLTVGGYLEAAVEFQPFYAMRHALAPSARDAYWFTSRRRSLRKEDDGLEVELAFTDAQFAPRSPGGEHTGPVVETITAHVTCSNRDLPTHLPFGGAAADFTLESEASVGRVRLLTEPSKPLRPPLGRATQWRLISQLGLNHLSLIENGQGPEALRQVLALYDFADTPVTRAMIEGIIEVSSRRVAGRTGNRLGNTLSLGMEVRVRFDEDAFAGAGAFLMACVLERFLGAYVTINSFTQMVATSKQREGDWKRWQPRCGDRTLL
jgi:type VI secretion system protein ImpG